MVFDVMFDQTEIIGSALQGLSLRNEVIQNNLANIDTSNFKKSEVFFEESLQKAIKNSKETGRLDLSKVKLGVKKVHEDYSYRIDGNNVDVDIEMAALYQNGFKYETLTAGITNYYRQISSVLTGR